MGKQNPVAINDLDESKIQSIIQQATKANKNKNGKKSNNPFEFDMNENNPDIIEEKKEDYDDEDVLNENQTKNGIHSHYKIINNEFMNLRKTMKDLQNKIKLESYLN